MILALLDQQPDHGYSLMLGLRGQTRIEISDGSLYPALYRLEHAGKIDEISSSVCRSDVLKRPFSPARSSTAPPTFSLTRTHHNLSKRERASVYGGAATVAISPRASGTLRMIENTASITSSSNASALPRIASTLPNIGYAVELSGIVVYFTPQFSGNAVLHGHPDRDWYGTKLASNLEFIPDSRRRHDLSSFELLFQQ